MLKNYFLIAFRNLRKHPLYAFVNVVGLALGLACCTFIVLYVMDEVRYDRFHADADQIYRVVEDWHEGDRESYRATTYGAMAWLLEEEFPVIDDAVRVLPYPLLVTPDSDTKYQEDGVYFVDSTFLNVFNFPLKRGEAATALEAPFSVVLSEPMAHKYFGDAEAVGQLLQVRDDEAIYEFTVTGVLDVLPSNTHFQFDMLASFSSMRTMYSPWVEDAGNWDHPPLYTYVKLDAQADAGALEAQLPAFADRRVRSDVAQSRTFRLQALTDIRLKSAREEELTPGSNITYVYLFGLIAFFILLIACINFMNLATARAAGRAQEVGLRKALGAQRSQLMRQFLSESMLMVAVALLLVIVLVEALLPVFNAVSGKTLASGVFLHWTVPLLLLGTVVVVGLLAGSYPALYLSAFRPARVLKGATTTASRMAVHFRKGLVVFQFAVSIALIIGTGVIYQQLHYAQNERLGFDKEHVVLIPMRDVDNQYNYTTLKTMWQQIPGVAHVTASSGMPGLDVNLRPLPVHPEGSTDTLSLDVLTVDHDYAETYGLEIVAGRDFDEAFPVDATSSYLINESAAARFGWDDPVGKTLTASVWFNGHSDKEGQIVGVVKDFQYHSLRHGIDPLVFHIFPNTYYYDYVAVRLHPNDISETLAALEAGWAQFNPARPFEYRFLDEQFDALYRTEERLGTLFGYFAALAVLIACLGLFGLAAFTAEQRTKEIGVRKVLGASVAGIILLLSKDLLKLIAVAFVLAVPLAYVAMQGWLAGFAYRIELPWTLFIITGLGALAVAWLTVSFHAIRAALADPVKSLRYE